MSNSKAFSPPDLPPSLRNFLTVTEADGAPRTGEVKPSPLLSRVQAFLPKMAAANEMLPENNPEETAVQVARVSGEENEENQDSEGDAAVKMDLYIDETLGKLVGGATFDAGDDSDESDEDPGAEKKDDTGKKRPLIQVLPQEEKLEPDAKFALDAKSPTNIN